MVTLIIQNFNETIGHITDYLRSTHVKWQKKLSRWFCESNAGVKEIGIFLSLNSKYNE